METSPQPSLWGADSCHRRGDGKQGGVGNKKDSLDDPARDPLRGKRTPNAVTQGKGLTRRSLVQAFLSRGHAGSTTAGGTVALQRVTRRAGHQKKKKTKKNGGKKKGGGRPTVRWGCGILACLSKGKEKERCRLKKAEAKAPQKKPNGKKCSCYQVKIGKAYDLPRNLVEGGGSRGRGGRGRLTHVRTHAEWARKPREKSGVGEKPKNPKNHAGCSEEPPSESLTKKTAIAKVMRAQD